MLIFILCLRAIFFQPIYSFEQYRLRGNDLSGSKVSVDCPQQYLHMIGDGWCDYGAGGMDLNIEECNFDGGDCCVGSCGITSGSYDSSVSFYCGVVGYNCLDPTFVNKTTNSSKSIIDTAFANATTIVVSETYFQGTALLMNVLAGKSHQLSNVFQSLSWSALDLASSNVIITTSENDPGSESPTKRPPKPPRPPVHPMPPPHHPHQQESKSTTRSTIKRRERTTATEEQEVEVYSGERWVVMNIQVHAGSYRHRNAVATVSWTMAFQQFQLVNVNLSNEKSIQNRQRLLSLSNQHVSEMWLSSNILERSFRFAAQSSSLSAFANVKVCSSQVRSTNETFSFTYSNDDIEECLQNYSAYGSNRYVGDLSSLYESPLCQQRMSDAWQDRYGQEEYLQWMIAYASLWLLVWLFALKYWMYHASFSCFPCVGCFDGLCTKPSHQLLAGDNHSSNDPQRQSSVEMRESAHGSTHSQGHQLSGRRHHRRRILEHVLMFYSVPGERSNNVEADEPNNATADATFRRMSMLSQLWYLLRIPGFFSRSMLSLILVIVASLRAAHYFWILAPYLTVLGDSSANEDEKWMVKRIIVCREFSFLVEREETSSSKEWKDGYLIALWLMAFHVCLCWSLVSAVARHVHVAVRRSMVVLSLPYLPQSPPLDQTSNVPTVGKETNPLSSGLPYAPLSEGTVSASAISGTQLPSSNGLVLTSINALHPAVDMEHRGEVDTLSVRASHGTLVPALLHLQILHFMIICVVLTMLVFMITWMVLAVILQKTHISSIVRDGVLRNMTGSGVEIFLQWVQRVTGAIFVLESVILLFVSHWLAHLHYVVYQQRFARSDEGSVVEDRPAWNVKAWIVVYASSICLLILGVLTILVSHQYFQQTEQEEDFMVEDTTFEHRQEMHVTIIFSTYSLALRIVELLTVVMVGMFLSLQDLEKMFIHAPSEDDHRISRYGSGLSTPHFYSDEATLVHQAIMEGNPITGYHQHVNSIQKESKQVSNINKNTIQKSFEVKATEMELHSNGDAKSVSSNQTGRSGGFGFGYGYEGIGPIWLSLNWVRHWQKQEEQYSKSSNTSSIENGNDLFKSCKEQQIKTNVEEVHNTWWHWHPHQKQANCTNAVVRNNNDCVFEEENNSNRFHWTNPMSSMIFGYHPLIGSNTTVKTIVDSQEERKKSHQSHQSSSASTVILTDVVGHTSSSANTFDVDQSVSMDESIAKSDSVWPSSLFHRRSSPHSQKGIYFDPKEKLSVSKQDIHLVEESFIHKQLAPVSQDEDSVMTKDFLSESSGQQRDRESFLYAALDTNVSSHGNSPLTVSPSN